MDDYKRALYMRVHDKLIDPASFHDSICFMILREIGIDKGSYLQGSAPGLSFLEDLLPEMDALFDSKQWFQPEEEPVPNRWPAFWETHEYCFNDGNDYWWSPCDWAEPRIAMLDFLLNNR